MTLEQYKHVCSAVSRLIPVVFVALCLRLHARFTACLCQCAVTPVCADVCMMT